METDVLIVGGGFGGATAAKRLESLLAASAERVQLVVSNPGIPPYRSETIVWAAGQRPLPW